MFPAHGNYILDSIGEVIIVRFIDQWNIECSIQFFKDYTKYVTEKSPNRFGIIADLTKLTGATPEAVFYFRKITQWGNKNGQVARAQIIDSDFKFFTVRELQENNDIFPIVNFKDENLAFEWLKKLGLRIN